MYIGGSFIKRTILNVLLSLGVIVPIIMLFYPYDSWGDVMSLILRIIPSFSAQILFCRIAKHRAVEAFLFLLTGAFALWATDLYMTSPNWNRASFWNDYIADCVSPFLCCLVVYLVSIFRKEREDKDGRIEGNHQG